MRSVPFLLKTKGFEDMRSEKGFTLVEMAVVLVIAGLVMGGAMVLMKPFVQNAQINTTKIRLENIANSLALYAQTYGRLPCPADENPTIEPFGAPRNSGVDGDDWDNECTGGTTGNQHVGIVPFRALGLSEDNAKDAYGNFVTYAVAPVLAGSTAGFPDRVHEACRQPIWFDGGTVNLNPEKARVCCARWLNAVSEITVNDSRTAGNSLFTGQHATGAGGPYDGIDIEDTSGVAPDTDTRFIAFVLNSTGENGEQALVRSPDTRKPRTTVANAQERENNDYNNLTFVSRPRSVSNDDNYFDDIILWRTNDQVVSNFGNDSCNKP